MKTNNRIIGILVAVAIILSIPLIAMQFTNEVNWTVFDFIIAGLLLVGISFLLELVVRKISKKGNRIIWFSVIIAIFLLIWMELAVGIFGTPFAGS